MTNCKYITKNGRCGLKGSYAYRHGCFGEDMCRCREPMTNADRIRAMTDEELVNLHYSGSAHCIASDPTVCDRHDFIGNLTPCEQCYLKWLQQPAG